MARSIDNGVPGLGCAIVRCVLEKDEDEDEA